MSRFHVTAKTYIEIEVGLSGSYVPGCGPSGGGRFELPINPPEPESMEDIEVTRIGGLKRELSASSIRGSHPWTYHFVDLLDGVDPKSEAYAIITTNVLKFLGDEAEAELLGEVGEDA